MYCFGNNLPRRRVALLLYRRLSTLSHIYAADYCLFAGDVLSEFHTADRLFQRVISVNLVHVQPPILSCESTRFVKIPSEENKLVLVVSK